MMKVLALLVLALITSSTVVPRVDPVHSHIPRTYKVNLDDPAQKRWEHILKDYAQPLKRFMDYFDLLPIPNRFYEGVEWYAKHVYKHQDFVAEVDVISKLTGYNFDKLFFINFMYQYSTFKACTGILITNSAGQVLHGRNLDFQMWDLLAKLVVNVQYYQGKKKVFSIDTIVGSVFALTGIKPGSFAVNVDTRYAKNFGDDLISVLVDDAIPTCWLLRKVLQEEVTYKGAIKRLSTQRIGGPVYYIISGINPYQGTVIQRNVNSVHAYYQLSPQNWFIVQSNYDRDYPDPIHDPRRVPVEQRLRERGNIHFQKQTLMDDYMFQWPTFNIATIMTAIMIPSEGYHNTTVWYGYNPSPPPSQNE